MRKKLFASAGAFVCSLSTMQIAHGSIQVESKRAGGHDLTIYKSWASSVEFRQDSPSEKDENVELAIPAAFTMAKQKIDGLGIVNGKNVGGAVNSHLSGAAFFLDGDYSIISSSALTSKCVSELQSSRASAFQQFQLVRDGVCQSFKDKQRSPRRALVIFYGAHKGVVQSNVKLTMSQFAQDLRSIGVRDALYTPSGDGGWYHDVTKTVNICTNPTPSVVPSNWVVIEKTQASDLAATEKWLRKHRAAAAVEP